VNQEAVTDQRCPSARTKSTATKLAIPTQGRRIHGPFACCIPKQKADNTGDNEVENRADHHAAHSTEQHEDVGLTKQHPTIRAPIKALRMQVTEKPRESQMSPLALMFAVGYCSLHASDDTGR
jgi:hypothetical protein